MTRNWTEMSAMALGRGIAAGRIDPRALTEMFLAAIDESPDHARIYARTTPERARAEAAAAADRAARDVRRGALDGVPISWKDLFDAAGAATEAGSKLLAGRTPNRDARVLERATRAGMVCLGKTHMSELAFSGLGINPMTGTPPNRFDPDAAPGGSSSGAAASVAFGLAAAGIGSDTGGSVRIPAAWNALVGLKTTAGLIPCDGVVPLSPTLDTIGPLTRTVEDAAQIFAVLAARPAADLGGATLGNARLLVPQTTMLDDCESPVRNAFEAMLERLSAQGALIERRPVPEFAETSRIAAGHGSIVNTEGYAIWRDRIEAEPEKMFPLIRERFRTGGAYSAGQSDFARIEFSRLKRAYLARTAGYDAVLAPTAPILPPPVARLMSDEREYIAANGLALRNTRIGNLLGLCALTLPITGPEMTPAPIGIMLIGAPETEARLLRLGTAIERL